MKKLVIYSATLIFVTAVYFTVKAANGQGSGTPGTGSGTGTQGQGNSLTQPVQNQNQVKTQNQGEDTQLQVQTQEKQGTETGAGANLKNGAGQGKMTGLPEYRSMVAQQLHKLLGANSAPGGVGEQVRNWARQQQQAENNIQAHLNKTESRSEWLKALIGPNYQSLKALRREMEQNQVRVKQLEQLKLQLTNSGELSDVQEMVTLMQKENTSLQEKINSEEKQFGMFGWLFRLFVS